MPKKKPAKTDETFEESLAALEQVVADLEEGQLGLAESLDRYEEGIGRLKRCHAQLEAAERRVELLSGVDSEGNPIATKFDESAGEELAKKQSTRSSKRSAKKPPKPTDGVDDEATLF